MLYLNKVIYKLLTGYGTFRVLFLYFFFTICHMYVVQEKGEHSLKKIAEQRKPHGFGTT